MHWQLNIRKYTYNKNTCTLSYFPAPALSVSGSKGQNRSVYSQATQPPRFKVRSMIICSL